jgi:hypothetical protein
MRNRRSTEIIAILSGAAALLTLFFSSCELPPRSERQIHASIGKALAKEALRLRGTDGPITVITRDTEAFPQPALDILLASFERALRREGATLASVQLVQADPLRPVDVPPGDFYELIRRSKPGHVIVSLLGPPLLTADQQIKLGRVQARIVALCSGTAAETVDLRKLFQAGLLHAAVVSRTISAAPSSGPSDSPRGFDALYRVVLAGDVADLRLPPGSKL